MAFKALTNKGKEFIRTVCSGGGNSLLRGSNSYPLNFSNDPANKLYIASPRDRFGSIITTNEKLGIELIKWFTDYSELYELDANIIAAQAYIESNYRLWGFPNTASKSSAQGISQFLSSTLYDVVIANKGASGGISTIFTDDEINRLTAGMTNPRDESSYIYTSNSGGFETATNNRVILFQNCLNNPDLLIKAQCKYVKGISVAAADNAATTLFCYNQGPAYRRSTFTATLKKAESSLSNARYKDGLNYVNRIFRVLGDPNASGFKPAGVSFGYAIDFTFDEFTADVKSSNTDIDTINKSTRLSKNYVLSDLITTSNGQINIPTQDEFEKLELFAENVLEKINTLIGKVLIINSSFRSEAVNSSVGGVVTSQHRLAEAADVRVETNDIGELNTIYEKIINSDISYDQIILERKGTAVGQRWIHISYKSRNTTANRFEKLIATFTSDGVKYTPYDPNNLPLP